MNSNIYYRFELYSREEFYRKNKPIFNEIYNDPFVKKFHNIIVSRGTFAFMQSFASLFFLRKILKNDFKLKIFGKTFAQLILIAIINANLFLRNFKTEFPFDNSSEANNQNYFILFSKSLVNHNFCLVKDLYLVLILNNLRFLFMKENPSNAVYLNIGSITNQTPPLSCENPLFKERL